MDHLFGRNSVSSHSVGSAAASLPAFSAASEPSVPVVDDGTDAECSICQTAFTHDDRVARLACRHVFHHCCWNRYMSTPEGNNPRPTRSCPNCRGAGTVIATWNYIESGRTTQQIEGVMVTHDLDRNAIQHNIVAPEFIAPSTPRSLGYEDRPGHRDRQRSQYSPRSAHFLRTSYPIQTKLVDGRPSIINDPGSVGSLCGDRWAKVVAIVAGRNGHRPSHERRPRPLEVFGLGKGTQVYHFDCSLPVAFRTDSGNKQAVVGNLLSPAAMNSDMPGLLGPTALRKNRAVLDFTTLKLYFCGPADYEIANSLPEGTDTFQLEIAPPGHIVLPCCEYQTAGVSHQRSLTLLTRSDSRYQRDHDSARAASEVPPPPSYLPILPPEVRREASLADPPSSSAC